jgi:hypothetical protein
MKPRRMKLFMEPIVYYGIERIDATVRSANPICYGHSRPSKPETRNPVSRESTFCARKKWYSRGDELLAPAPVGSKN